MSPTRYRRLYARLLRLYPRAYRERFAEGMEQTFHDLLRDRAARGRGLAGCALWMAVETMGGIVKENLLDLKKPILIVGAATAALLLVPLVAMRFTDEVRWSPLDFVFAAALLFGAGMAFVVVSRRASGFAYRAAVAVAVGASLFLAWANGAVGLLGPENHPANLMYGIVIATGVLGAALARFNARGMSRTMLAMALAQVAVPVLAAAFWIGIPEPKVAGVTAFFVALFLVAALLFRAAGSRPRGLEVQE